MFIWAYPTIHAFISIYAFRCHILNLMKYFFKKKIKKEKMETRKKIKKKRIKEKKAPQKY